MTDFKQKDESIATHFDTILLWWYILYERFDHILQKRQLLYRYEYLKYPLIYYHLQTAYCTRTLIHRNPVCLMQNKK